MLFFCLRILSGLYFRCIANEMSQKSDITPIERMSNQCAPEGANNECTEAAFSGKVSISVADAGETALVVSMVSGNQWTLEPSKNSILTSQIHENSDSDISYVVAPSNERNCSQLILEGKGLELSLSCDTSSDLVPLSLSFDGLKSNSVDEEMNESSSFDGARTSSSLSKFHSGGKISESESRMGLHLGLSVGSFLSGMWIYLLVPAYLWGITLVLGTLRSGELVLALNI